MLEVPRNPPWGFLPKVQPQQHCVSHGLSPTSTFITHFKERAAAKIIISLALPISVSVPIQHPWGPPASQLRWSMTYLPLSLTKPSRAALELLKAPQSIHSIAKTSLWAWKVRDGTIISVTAKTRPQAWRMQITGAVSWSIRHHSGSWQLRWLSVFFWRLAWAQEPQKASCNACPLTGNITKPSAYIWKRGGFFTLLVHSSTEDFF